MSELSVLPGLAQVPTRARSETQASIPSKSKDWGLYTNTVTFQGGGDCKTWLTVFRVVRTVNMVDCFQGGENCKTWLAVFRVVRTVNMVDCFQGGENCKHG